MNACGGTRGESSPGDRDHSTWRLILGDGGELRPLDGATNMALDAALLASVQAGGPPVLRFYRWDPACLSFGRNQPARGLYDVARARTRGIDFVRRPTGGQAVLHDDELTYAVVAPLRLIGRPRDAYRRINQALVAGLLELGIRAMVAPAMGTGAGGAGKVEWSDACFRRPAPGEVVAGGRKLVGSAQRTEGRVILQHGSLLLGGSQGVAEDLLFQASRGVGTGAGPARPGAGAAGIGAVGVVYAEGGAMWRAVGATPGWTTVDEELGHRPAWQELVTLVASGFETVFGTVLAQSDLKAEELESLDRLTPRFGSDDWTWRM